MNFIKNKLIYISTFIFLTILLLYWLLPGNIIFTNNNVTIYIEQYGIEKRYITEPIDKKKILNEVSDIKINVFKNQHLLFADDGIVITIYGTGIKYKNQKINVVHIYISTKNEINTIELDEKSYSFKKENTSLINYVL